MQHLSRADLLALKKALRLADSNLARARGLLICGGAARDAASVNALIGRIAHLIGRIDRALAAKR